MRYSDGPVVRCEVHVEAGPSQVWELVSDIELPARLSPELHRVQWLDGATTPVVGASFVGHNRHPVLGEWRTTSHIVECEPPRVFGWAVVDAESRFRSDPADPDTPMATWRFELAPEAGGTRLWQSARLGPGRSGVSLAIDRAPEQEEAIVSRRLDDLRAGIESTLHGIKAFAEGPEGCRSTSFT